jgi:arginine exporter protein ArgO
MITSHDYACIFMIISRSVILSMRSISDQNCIKNQTTLFTVCSITFFNPRRYLYFVVEVGLVWSNKPPRYAGGCIATGMACHDRQVEGDDPEGKG